MRTYLSGIILFLLACVSCTEKELPTPTTQDLSGTIWESEFNVESKKGQIPVKMTFYFDTEDKMIIYSVGPLTYDGLIGYYSLNKNILEYKVRLQNPFALLTGTEMYTWVIRKRTEKTMVWDPTPQGVDLSSYVNVFGATKTTPITLYKKS